MLVDEIEALRVELWNAKTGAAEKDGAKPEQTSTSRRPLSIGLSERACGDSNGAPRLKRAEPVSTARSQPIDGAESPRASALRC